MKDILNHWGQNNIDHTENVSHDNVRHNALWIPAVILKSMIQITS